MAYKQKNHEVSVHCALPDDVLLFEGMHAVEQLGRLFEFRVKMASTRSDIKLADVVGQGMTVKMALPNGGERYFNGIVTSLSNLGWRDGFAAYEATVHPALWLLTRSSNCRIFQDMSALDIVKEVCQGPEYKGSVQLEHSSLARLPANRTYCVQYRETDFNFITRLLEEEGIYYYFRHESDAHRLVLADSLGAHTKTKGYETLKYREDEGLQIADQAVTGWTSSGQIESSIVTLNDFDFEKMTSKNNALVVKSTGRIPYAPAEYEQYDYPGLYLTADEGTARGRARMESNRAHCEETTGSSLALSVTVGSLFKLTEHPVDSQNQEFLVTSAVSTVTGKDYRSGGVKEVSYKTTFTSLSSEHTFRASPSAERPVVRGPQTAIVVGKHGEEIWTDKYGRIKVQFHWDRLGTNDEKSSCWVRVTQGWAGKGWGAIFIPRVGMEVVVEFLEGDPDRPLVTGCVYNGDAMPPYALPENQTRSTIKSNSSKGGGGFNEIRFEDKKDEEEIFIQAEKNFNRVVKNNDTLIVGFEKKDKGDQTITIKNDQNLEVGHDQKSHVKNDQTLTIDQNQTVKIDGNQEITVGKKIVMEANTAIELKVGASTIKIEPAKITIKSPEIAIQSDAMMSIKAGAIMTVEGALVKIN